MISTVSTSASAKRTPAVRLAQRKGTDWLAPSDEDLREIARAMTPFVRFLNPGIDPVIYLWEGSSCALPGVRRYAGSTEIAVFLKRAKTDEVPPQCLVLNDNDHPRH